MNIIEEDDFGKVGESRVEPQQGSDSDSDSGEDNQIPIQPVGSGNGKSGKEDAVDLDQFTNLNCDEFDSSSLKASKSEFDYRVPVVHNIEQITNLTIDDARKNSKGIFNEFFTYKIHYNNNQVSRRFSDFDKLHKYLVNHYDFCFFPHLPEKNPLTKIKNLAGANFLNARRKSLELFLKKLLTHSKCKEDSKVSEFLDGTFTEFNVDVGESTLKAFASDLASISKKNFGKATNFFKGLFSKKEELEVVKDSESCEEMKKIQVFVKDMYDKISKIILHFKKVIEKLKQKAEASETQAKTFNDIILGQGDFALSGDLLNKLKTIQETVSYEEREFAVEMKETVLFYLQDIKKDLKEALNRIEDSLTKGDTLTKIIEKCERKGDQQKEEIYKSKREGHDKNQDVLRSEVVDYVKQVSESIENVFDIYFKKSNDKNNFEVDKWGEIDLNDFGV